MNAAGGIRGFASYFKRYMGAAAISVAALPIPAASFRLIPCYQDQRGALGVYTSLFTFLVLAFLFYSRHWIADYMFSAVKPGVYRARPLAAWFPLLLILCSLAMVFCYNAELNASIRERVNMLLLAGLPNPGAYKVLAATAESSIPRATLLIILYLGIFLFAEAAFVMMALREYLQDLLGITEKELLRRLGS